MGGTIYPLVHGVYIEVEDSDPPRYLLWLADGSSEGLTFDLTPLLVPRETEDDADS